MLISLLAAVALALGLAQIWSRRIAQITATERATRRIVFIGYSLSDGDVHIKALFKKHIRPDVDLVAINPKPTRKMRLLYAALSRNTRFCQRTFEELVQDDAFMKELVTGTS